jgi:leucyl-tRNA synthetase
MKYDFREIELNAKVKWQEQGAYKVKEDPSKPPFYVLDMFPYPSGAGLHVGHPLGYIASDILARYKVMMGYSVLHPMGFDAFGLPAEQYAIQTNRHPEETTKVNIERYKEQLNLLGLGYDWSRSVTTSDPSYYKWTQWIFLQLFNCCYHRVLQRPVSIEKLFEHFDLFGCKENPFFGSAHEDFTVEEWRQFNLEKKAEIAMYYRLAYQADAWVNWCEELGTVLANDEVKDGFSERGGHPVERKRLKQWFLRISAYADRLLLDLDGLNWSAAMKEMQSNWIGKSEGASLTFKVVNSECEIEVFTTRPDTLFGVSFMVLAPEHPMLNELVQKGYEEALEYAKKASNRSERERQAGSENVTGAFTGSYAIHPVSGEELPVWVGDYVLAGYGTGAVMAVPAHDARDYKFARAFNLPILSVIELPEGMELPYESKDGRLINSLFLDGLHIKEGISSMLSYLEEHKLGVRTVNYRLRDANFSRQRYWGEPFPIVYSNGIATAINEKDLPVELPYMEDFKPTGRPESPLKKAEKWTDVPEGIRETDTMPGFAGSSWYFLRFMDPNNQNDFASRTALNYWKQVDVYIGGTEHAVGHLLYARFWHKFLFDLGYLPINEPFKRLVNQGMILGRSNLVYRETSTGNFVSAGLVPSSKKGFQTLHVDVNAVQDDALLPEQVLAIFPEARLNLLVLEDGVLKCGVEIEKMSKSKFNVVNPDAIVEDYGADTLRMYEMFLGPIEQSKPWNTQGIEGVNKFLRRVWRHCISEEGICNLSEEAPEPASLKSLHTLLKRLHQDIEAMSMNTCVSAFMICLNELLEQNCKSLEVFRSFSLALSPFAPFISEALWEKLGGVGLACKQEFPKVEEKYLIEDNFSYPVSFNGKRRFDLVLSLSLSPTEIEREVLNHPETKKWIEGKPLRKVIVVPSRIVNIVLG